MTVHMILRRKLQIRLLASLLNFSYVTWSKYIFNNPALIVAINKTLAKKAVITKLFIVFRSSSGLRHFLKKYTGNINNINAIQQINVHIIIPGINPIIITST